MLIYKITNLKNGKCYVGQTIKSAEQRWKEHQQHAFGQHCNDRNKKLYQAIREEGIENFTFEVLQDGITNFLDLDKAEIYWIDYYKAFLEGYNQNRGGQQYHKSFPNEEIIADYYKTRSARKTALNFGIDHNTVDTILNDNNIPRFSFRQSAGQRIKISKKDFEKEFDSVRDCAEWFVENNIPRTKSPESVRTGLKNARSATGNGFYYGYLIENI